MASSHFRAAKRKTEWSKVELNICGYGLKGNLKCGDGTIGNNLVPQGINFIGNGSYNEDPGWGRPPVLWGIFIQDIFPLILIKIYYKYFP